MNTIQGFLLIVDLRGFFDKKNPLRSSDSLIFLCVCIRPTTRRDGQDGGNLEIEITILIILLNISCKIIIPWYIYIIAFGSSASLGLLPLGAGNIEKGTIKLGTFILNFVVAFHLVVLAKLEGPGVPFSSDYVFIISIIALFYSVNVFTITAISLSGILKIKLDKQIEV